MHFEALAKRFCRCPSTEASYATNGKTESLTLKNPTP